jgi:hypothetical protein
VHAWRPRTLPPSGTRWAGRWGSPSANESGPAQEANTPSQLNHPVHGPSFCFRCGEAHLGRGARGSGGGGFRRGRRGGLPTGAPPSKVQYATGVVPDARSKGPRTAVGSRVGAAVGPAVGAAVGVCHHRRTSQHAMGLDGLVSDGLDPHRGRLERGRRRGGRRRRGRGALSSQGFRREVSCRVRFQTSIGGKTARVECPSPTYRCGVAGGRRSGEGRRIARGSLPHSHGEASDSQARGRLRAYGLTGVGSSVGDAVGEAVGSSVGVAVGSCQSKSQGQWLSVCTISTLDLQAWGWPWAPR